MAEMSTLNGYEIVDEEVRNALNMLGAELPMSTFMNGKYEIVDKKAREKLAELLAGGGLGGGGESVIDRTVVNYNNDNLAKIGMYAFARCDKLESIDCPSVTYIDDYAFNYCTALTNANFPLAQHVGEYAFGYCSSNFSVIFPEVTTLESNAFASSSIVSASFPKLTKLDTSTFSYCRQLSSANFPEVIKTGGSVFYNCSALKSISLPKLTELLGGSLFYSCTALKNVNLPMLGAIRQSNVFGGTAIEELTLPEVKYIGTYNNVLADMKQLKHISLPKLISISSTNYMMKNDTNVETINVPSLETISSATEVFSPSVFNISLPSIKTISSSSKVFAASNCSINLRRIDLGHITSMSSKSTSTSDNIFYGVYDVLALIIRTESVLENITNELIYMVWASIYGSDAFVYVPRSVIDGYKTTYNSCPYCFRAIEDYPEICAVDWDRNKTNIVKYVKESGYLEAMMGVSDNVVDLPDEFATVNINNGWSFVGWYESPEFTGDEAALTEYYTNTDCILYGLYSYNKRIYWCYGQSKTDQVYTDFYRINNTYPVLKLTPRIDPDTYSGWEFIGWTNSKQNNFYEYLIPVDDNGNVLLTFNNNDITNTYFYIGAVYKQNVVVKYWKGSVGSSDVVEDGPSSRYYTPTYSSYTYYYSQPSFVVKDNMFENPGYKFVRWEYSNDKTPYNPGDTFIPGGSITSSETSLVYSLCAVWEEDV